MRLLSTKSLKVVSIREDDIPPYAILSHTWGTGEVTLQDMQRFGAKWLSNVNWIELLREGVQKVLGAAKLAASEGHDWIWIDTCCIDKTSSSELSEAINSMYRWYQGAEICYVHLADATLGNKELQTLSDHSLIQWIRDSRWVTRGWTLQELIAPQSVSLYSKDWLFIGKSTDERIMSLLAEATGIDIGVLSGDIATQEVSVANRMRWASKRKTTRPEDMAYCLMGLFNVNMPLLYGEGAARSFVRLQVEILQATDDQTIFAWSAPLGSRDYSGVSGLLAESPAYFRDAPRMYPVSDWYRYESSTPWSMTNMTNRGLMVQLYLQPSKPEATTEEGSVDDFVAVLYCSAETTRVDDCGREWIHEHSPAILLRRLWGDQFARVNTDDRRYVRVNERQGGQVKTVFVKQEQSRSLLSFAIPDRFLRGIGTFILSAVYPRDLWDSKSGIFRSGLSRQQSIQGLFRFSYAPGNGITDGLFDVAVALQSTGPVGFLRPPGGRTLRQAYDYLNRIWASASQDGKADLADEYRDKMTASLQLSRTQRLGGVHYVLDLLAKAELEHTVPDKHPDWPGEVTPWGVDEPEAPPLPSAREQLELLFKPFCVSENSQPGRLISLDKKIRVRQRKELNLEPQRPKISDNSMFDVAFPSPCKSFLRESRKSILQEINCDRPNTEDEKSFVFSQIVAGLAEGDSISIAQANKSCDTDEVVQYGLSEDRLAHFVAFLGNPQLTSWRLDQCSDLVGGLTGEHIASVMRNALDFREFLEEPEKKADYASDALCATRQLLGAVQGTQDTALHLIATYSTKKEFMGIMSDLTRAIQCSGEWDDFQIDHERSYLFRLPNGNGETILHRAAAMSNFGVVSYICEKDPDLACQLDSMNRSTLWHAACGGDDRIILVIGTALKVSEWAPAVDYPDDNGLTPLHVACREGYENCVTALLDLGASPLCAAQSSGLTPVHYASLFGHSDCLTAMAQHPDARSAFTQVVEKADDVELIRPIHLAAANGWSQCVRLLTKYGSPVSPLASVMCIVRDSPSRSSSRSSPILIDQTSSHPPGRTEVEVREIQLSTPKEVAAERGWDDVFEILEFEEGLQEDPDLAGRVITVTTPALINTGLRRTLGAIDLLELLHSSSEKGSAQRGSGLNL